MACTLRIVQVRGLTLSGDPRPQIIRVTGTSTGCDEVYVESSCTKFVSKLALVDSNGQWTVDLPIGLNHTCRCEDKINIRVSCYRETGQPPATAPTCSATFSNTLQC